MLLRKLVLITATGFFCGAIAIADDEKKAEPPKTGETKPGDESPKGKLGKLAGKVDKAKIFEKLDADGDGKITKEEFKKFGETIKEKLEGKGKGGKLGDQLGDKLFDKIDANGDGKITKEEFEKYEFPGAAGLKGKLDEKKGEEKKSDEKKTEEKKEGKG